MDIIKAITLVGALAASYSATAELVTTSNESGCDTSVLKKISTAVHPNQKVYEGFSSCKKIPNNPELTIIAELLERSEDPNTFDLIVVVTKSDSGEVIGKYFEKEHHFAGAGSDMFDTLKVDTANYRLNADTRAFGVMSGHGRFCCRDTFREDNITLFTMKDSEIKPIMGELNLHGRYDIPNGELDCALIADQEVKRTIVMTENYTNGFKDILINEKNLKYKITKKSCEQETIEKTTVKKYILKYDNKKGFYNIPENIGILPKGF